MKIFSNHRKKIEPHRRFGSREFKSKLLLAKNYKRSFSPNSEGGVLQIFKRAGISKVAVFTLTIIFGVIFYFLVISPYFEVTSISVSGNNQVTTSDIEAAITEASKHRFFLVKKNNFFLLNQSSVSKLVTSNTPLVREVKSSRKWPNKITLAITERIPTLTLSANDSFYLVDDQGYIVTEMSDQQNLLLVADQVSEEIKVGETIEGKLIPFIISLKQLWPTKLSQPISMVKIPGKGASEVEFVSAEGWSVLFSIERPVINQMNNLILLLNKQIGANKANLAYVDLRLAKWAYYCLKSTPCTQTDQESLANTTPQTSGSTEVKKDAKSP